MLFNIAATVSVFALFSGTTSAQMVGQGTYFYPGLGACGITNTNSDHIVAVSHLLFDTYPGAGSNPNDNPICNKPISITYNGITASATITDRCAGCAGMYDLDMSPSLFEEFADLSVGRLYGVEWVYT